MPTPAARAQRRAHEWARALTPEDSRPVVWGHHDTDQPARATFGGLLADWGEQDNEAAGLWPASVTGITVGAVEGFEDGSVRLIGLPVGGIGTPVLAYGHFVDALPEDGPDAVVFQVARLVAGSHGHRHTVTGAHHSSPDWDRPNATRWSLDLGNPVVP